MVALLALDPLALAHAFACTRDALSAAFADEASPQAAEAMVLSVVLPPLTAAVTGWELGLREGSLPRSVQRDLLRRAGVPDREPTIAEGLVAAAERARSADHLYLPAVELSSAAILGTWIGLAPRLDPEWISWPTGRPSYRDLIAPRTVDETISHGEALIAAALTIVVEHARPRPRLRPLMAVIDVAAAVDRRGLGAWPGLIARS